MPWFALVLILIGVTSFFVSRLAIMSAEAELKASQQLSVRLASQALAEDLTIPTVHIRSLALLEQGFRTAVNKGEFALFSGVEEDFQTLLLRNPTYSQIRWIDETGMEKVRVDRVTADQLRTLASEELQDKSDRPYTQYGLQLGHDELYVSEIDLNIENGEIEKPFKPTVRFAMRVFDDSGAPAGVLVLNVNAAEMLSHLPEYAGDHSLTLLNQDGYWIVGRTPEEQWGFMFDQGTSFALQNERVWSRIRGSEQGQEIVDAALYSWQSIRVNTGRPDVKFNIELKAVAELPAEQLAAARYEAIRQIVVFSIFVFLLLSGALFLLVREIEQRERAQREAMVATKAKSSFLAIMSHEIRTPMTGIMGFADMLLEDNLSAESKKMVGRIQSSAQSLLSIINDILDISKLDAGKFEIERIDFRPAELANDVVQLFYQTCPVEKKTELQITATVSKNFPAYVNADPTRIRQILMNLVGNAVKFTEKGSVTVACNFDDVHSQLTFDVIDTGIGIGKDKQLKLFEEFVQADASISRKFQGTGLGLAVCKRLIALMGGEIGVRSEPGKGSTFWFRVPCEIIPEHQVEADEKQVSAVVEKAERQLSILVAEDNEINQMIIRNIIEKMGHSVSMVKNGLEAVQSFKSQDYDLILMDIRMPEMSGPDATRQIRQSGQANSDIPIIALTADVMAENRASYFEAGMNDCVAKPIDTSELAAAIATATAGVHP